MVPLKYLSNFWRTLAMPLINCGITFLLKWSKNYVLVAGIVANENPSFQISDTNFYVPVETLSTQETVKLLKQLESCFKRTINYNKCLAKTKNQARNRHFNFLIDTSFQGLNRLLVLPFENDNGRISHKQCYLPTVKIRYFIVMIDGRNFFDEPIKNDLKHMIKLERLQQLKVMITQQDVHSLTS